MIYDWDYYGRLLYSAVVRIKEASVILSLRSIKEKRKIFFSEICEVCERERIFQVVTREKSIKKRLLEKKIFFLD
jgi:hypothetical protein